jgi:hypothetical protein
MRYQPESTELRWNPSNPAGGRPRTRGRVIRAAAALT